MWDEEKAFQSGRFFLCYVPVAYTREYRHTHYRFVCIESVDRCPLVLTGV